MVLLTLSHFHLAVGHSAAPSSFEGPSRHFVKGTDGSEDAGVVGWGCERRLGVDLRGEGWWQ